MNINPCCEDPFEKKGRLSNWVNLSKNTKRKIIMRANLIVLVTLITCMHVAAKGYAQKVSLTVKNANLPEVLKEIKKQTDYDPFYDSEQIKEAKKITISIKNASLEEVLDQCLKGQPFTYRILNKTIVLTYKRPTPSPKPIDKILLLTIRGKVTNNNNLPLVGVTVRIKGDSRGTVTNQVGNYTIEGNPDGVLVFSYVGFKTQEININRLTEINIVMVEDKSQLNETVIKGYYSTTNALNTGNVSVVKGEVLARQPVGDPLMALGGRVPGLITSQTSGILGSEVKVNLRGRNSLRSGNANNPLYIVDGVPFGSTTLTIGILGGAAREVSPFSSIKVNDIEDITILKDADATAIYGSRGANGVIIITTKKGKEGSTKFSVNAMRGTGHISNRLDLMNSSQYVQMRQKSFTVENKTPGTTDYDLNGGYGDINRYTDWQDVMIGGSAELTDAQVSISGGSAKTKFLISGSYRKETTVLPGNYNDKKGSIHFNVNHQSLNKKFQTNATVSYTKDNLVLPMSDFTQYILLAPNSPELHTADGLLNWQNSTWQNPLWQTIMSSRSVTDNLIGSVNLSYELAKNLTISSNFGFTDQKLEASTLIPFNNYDPAFPADPSYRSHQFGTTHRKSWIVEPKLSYTFQFAGGTVESLIGGTFNQDDQNGISQTATGFSSDALIKNVGSATSIKTNTTTASRYRYNAIFARIGYNYLNRYLLNVTARRDGSSRFGPGKQFGNFGAIGAAWIFSNEKFLTADLPFLSFGKLRSSYGITGNDQIGNYQYLSTYTPNANSYQGISALNPTSLTNPDYRWETVRKFETGLDLGFFNDRILLNVSWYKNRTGNQLVGYSLPAITGFTSVQANLPAVLQNTGTEFELTTINIQSPKIRWVTSFNLSRPRNKLVSFPNFASSSYTRSYVIGQPLSVTFKYHYTGIDPVKGVYTFEDVNKDGTITSAQDTKPVNIGVDFYGGLNNSIGYKGFQLDIFLHYVKQTGYKFMAPVSPGIFFADAPNQLASIANNNTIQRLTTAFGSPSDVAYILYKNSDETIGNQSFVRLKNISLSWELPEKYKKILRLNGAKVFIAGQNLLTITNSKNLDPENVSSGPSDLVMPSLRMISGGIQIDL